MPSAGCFYRESEIQGYTALTLGNGLVKATLLPEKGAEIYSLVYQPLGLDILWKSPWGLLRWRERGAAPAGGSEAAWLDHYSGGWQEIFPNGGDACSYRGAPLNFHGEASVREWDYSVRRRSSAAVTIEFSLCLCRSPFRIVRSVTVERSLPGLLIEESIENSGEEDLHFMWGHHPSFGHPFLDGGCRLQAPAKRFVAHEFEISPNCRIPAGVSGQWPVIGGKASQPVDLSIVPPATARVTEFGYLCDLEEGWYGLVSPAHKVGFGLAWAKDVFPYIWFWQELRGSFGYPWYGRCYVMAVEPFNSMPGSGLETVVARETAPVIKAGTKLQANLAAVFFPDGELETITTGGVVHCRQGVAGR